jgi:hypothetical protein
MVTSATKKTTPATRKPAVAARRPAAAKPASKPAAKTVKKVAAPKKVKVVRDSFSMPQDDYALIAKLKEKALAGGMQVKKSALLRAGLQMLDKSSALQLKRVISGLTPIKTGRPKKH